ncbi:MAG: hypothetical protein A2289_20110 [Deltaproteobacteria bacterium RIFOXYA12_FULL_58_15]|nr:MAG: hypothetical protein A2289_20110 [Deltaproteobacteria bacterium RIFOXYA12_FULL_58_15]OGR07155.1 MAG: hypothetical protein A2341_03405 [Deltaproteobacteria bacterium RIFOXYB12_FULL_58_9]
MPPNDNKPLITGVPNVILVVGGILLAGLLVAKYFATPGDVSEEQLLLIDGAINNVFWTALGSSLIAVLVLAVKMRRDTSAGVDIGPFVQLLATGDVARATALAGEQGQLTPAVENALRQISERHSASSDASGLRLRALEHIGTATTSLGESLQQQNGAIVALKVSCEASRDFFSSVARSIEGLSRSSEETSSSILEMVAINNEVSENIHNLALSVQETTTAIEEMTFSVKEVARNIEDLSTAAEETAASMNQMDVSISQVETNANETSRLSETVTSDAETGVAAINRTIQGIDRIKESSRGAAVVLGNLGEKIDEIGNILTVIDDVAEQTNLLALNAAIIAAQAGEHGRGFAVVADEIKALAERTGASTKEIADLIKTVQSESRNAIATMSKGVEAVEEGVRLGHNAEEALMKIVESAKRSTLMIKAIAQATVEQAKGSKQVTNAISRIAETVQQIALATSEQAKGSEQIMKSAERMRTITQQVERSTEEQNRGGQQVTEAMENIRDIVERVTADQDRYTNAAGKMDNASAQVVANSERARETLDEIEKNLAQMLASLDAKKARVG